MQKVEISKPKTIDPRGEANRISRIANCRNIVAAVRLESGNIPAISHCAERHCEGDCPKQSIFNSQRLLSKTEASTFNCLRADAQSRLSGILFALANGKLYFEELKIFSVPENHLPPCFATGGGTHSEVVLFLIIISDKAPVMRRTCRHSEAPLLRSYCLTCLPVLKTFSYSVTQLFSYL
jgi:hypothetical protein